MQPDLIMNMKYRSCFFFVEVLSAMYSHEPVIPHSRKISILVHLFIIISEGGTSS